MRRDVRFVPLCEALEERRVPSRAKLTLPHFSAAEMRTDAAFEKTHTPPGLAVAALHRKNTPKDIERPVDSVQSRPNAGSPTVSFSQTAAFSQTVSKTVSQAVERVDIVDKLRQTVAAADVAESALNTIDFVPPSLRQLATSMAAEGQVDPAEVPMSELDLRSATRGAFFTPLDAGLLARLAETAPLVPQAQQVQAETGNQPVAGRALPSRFERHFEIGSAADAFDELALALTTPLISNVDVLSRSIRHFLDQLDDLADEMGRSLADSPYATWCVVFGAGLAGGELARRLWKRKQMRSAFDREGVDGSSWAPGLPNGISTELA